MATQVFTFASNFIENLHVLPNGYLLISTIVTAGILYTVNPSSQSPQAHQVATFPSSITAVTGTAPIPGNGQLFAVGGGLSTDFAFANNSMSLFVVSLASGKIKKTIPVPGTETMNGLAALPDNPYTVLSADSIESRILRIDTLSSTVSVAFSDPALEPTANTVPLIGVNGIRIRDSYMYFTNSDAATFGRIPIDKNGNRVGTAEILAQVTGISDDFAFNSEGNAYMAVHPSSVVRITPEGVVSTIGEGVLYRQPTSVAMANDGKSIYVSTGGNGTAAGGSQILQIPLQAWC